MYLKAKTLTKKYGGVKIKNEKNFIFNSNKHINKL